MFSSKIGKKAISEKEDLGICGGREEEMGGSIQDKKVSLEQKKNAMEISLHRIPKYKPL